MIHSAQLHGDAATPDDLYAVPPPWDIGRPQAAFQSLADRGALQGRVLDVGCGTGEHVLMCAALGLHVTGIDLAATALRTAEAKAQARGLTASFLRHDALRLPDLGASFDTVLDCGLFHVFTDDERSRFAAGLRAVVGPGGRYFLLCLSDQDPGRWGGRMRQVRADDITTTFADGWRVDSIEPARIEITAEPGGIRAWLATVGAV